MVYCKQHTCYLFCPCGCAATHWSLSSLLPFTITVNSVCKEKHLIHNILYNIFTCQHSHKVLVWFVYKYQQKFVLQPTTVKSRLETDKVAEMTDSTTIVRWEILYRALQQNKQCFALADIWEDCRPWQMVWPTVLVHVVSSWVSLREQLTLKNFCAIVLNYWNSHLTLKKDQKYMNIHNIY